jgi:hypothetical protein
MDDSTGEDSSADAAVDKVTFQVTGVKTSPTQNMNSPADIVLLKKQVTVGLFTQIVCLNEEMVFREISIVVRVQQILRVSDLRFRK